MYNVYLEDRNKKAYHNIEEHLIDHDSAAMISAPGTGKSFVALEFISRRPDASMLFLAPTKSILKQFKRYMAKEGLLGDCDPNNMYQINRKIKELYPNLELRTYHWFHKHQTERNLKNKKYDYMICDEYHHTGGEKWYLSFNDFKSEHKETKYIGLSATPQRMDGQATMFSFDNDVVYNYSLAEAIVDGVLDVPKYIDFGIRYYNDILLSRQTIIDEFPEGEEKNKLLEEVNDFIYKINNYEGLEDILAKYLHNEKVLYFCPPTKKGSKIKAIDKIYNMKDKVFSKIKNNKHFYKIFSADKNNEEEEDNFINDSSDALRVLYTVNKYCEGNHPENIDAIIFGRGTYSVPLFIQMLGRALKSGRKKNKQPIVLDLAGNINIYQEIVTEIRKVATKRLTEGKKLPNNQSLDEFMHKFEIVDLELEQKKFLDILKKQIKDNRQVILSNNIIHVVDQIEEYCENNGEWPKQGCSDKFVSDTNKINSNQLAMWLKKSNFYSDFIYKDIKDQNGKLLIDRLNYLYAKYRHETVMVRKIQTFCENNGFWPISENQDFFVSSDDRTTSAQLEAWLHNSRYGKTSFKYANIRDENNELLIDTLDELSAKYKKNITVPINKEEFVIYRIKQIETFCQNNNEWPSHKEEVLYVSDEDRTTSHTLARWLVKYKYGESDFVYKDYTDENGISIKTKLDTLYLQYKTNKYIENAIQYVDKIQTFCQNNNEWPSQKKEILYVSDEDRTTSHQLASWLVYTNFNKGNFIYKNVKDKNGISLEKRLNILYAQYGKDSNRSRNYILYRVSQIEEYCENNGEWPKLGCINKFVSDTNETTSHTLASWLSVSGYNKGNFKYKDVKDENGVPIIDRLNKLYEIYGKAKRINEKAKLYNLEYAKKSNEIILNLYTMIILYLNTNSNSSLKIIEEIIIKNELKIDINDIVKLNNLEDKYDYLLNLYTNYSLWNNKDSAFLYKVLFNYYAVKEKKDNKFRH